MCISNAHHFFLKSFWMNLKIDLVMIFYALTRTGSIPLYSICILEYLAHVYCTVLILHRKVVFWGIDYM